MSVAALTDVDALLARTRLVPRRDTTARRAVVTFEQIAEGGGGPTMRHLKQLDFMQVASECEANGAFVHEHVIVMCSRRAAKSTGICGLMAKDASERNSVQIYMGKTRKAVKTAIWEKIWKPLCKMFFDGKCTHHETDLRTTFDTGAIVLFTGTDDQAHIDNYLGNGFRRAVIDECQSQADALLRKLSEVTLPPACSDRGGQLLLSGTIPEVPAGYFYETWSTGEGWLKRSWNRFDNPHMGTHEFQMQRLTNFMQRTKRPITDQLIRRDWFGEEAFDTSVTAYGYSIARDQYAPEEPKWLDKALQLWAGDPLLEHLHRTVQPDDGTCRHGVMAAVPLPGIEVFSCAIDPGAGDRFSVSVWGWGPGSPKVQHVFEFSSKRDAGLTWRLVAPVIKLVQQFYAPSFWWYDAGGSTVVMDGFELDTSLPALQPARKSARKLQVDKVRDLMIGGLLMVMAGSATEEDYQKARWDADKRAKMQWEWSNQWHPDPSESGRYALHSYFEMFEEDASQMGKTPDQIEREQHRAAHELEMRRAAARRRGMPLDEDMDATVWGAADEDPWG